MRKTAGFVVVMLVAAACSTGGGTDVAAGGGTDVAAGGGAGLAGGGFCSEARKIVAEIDAMDTEGMELGEIYGVIADGYGRLAVAAPAELKSDLTLMADAMRRLDEQFRTGEPLSLTDAEEQALDAAAERIDAYMENECGIDLDEEDAAASGDGVDVAPGAPAAGGGNRGTLTVTVGGETYTESLSGEFAVSCDMYGTLEDGSIGVYLEGSDFVATIASNNTGVTPGTYDGLIWVFAFDPDLDEQVYGLQEFDGPFVLDEAYEVTEGMWLFSGSFSLTASGEWPEASIEATFECVGPVGF